MEVTGMIKRIDQRLHEIGLSKMEFYALAGISSASVTQWRNGSTTPRIKTLEKIARVLGVSYEWLLFGDRAKKEAPALSKEDERLDSPVAWAKAWDSASPALRRAALAVLRSEELSLGDSDQLEASDREILSDPDSR